MLGPHFYYDLIRLARKPRNYYLRCGYLIALLLGWWYVFEQSQPFGGTINDYARLASNFSFSLLALQYAMILLLAPIYLAGTIVEERESGTLELLYQTDLSDREILLGKFAARVVHLIFFMLMSLPMLAIISLWGGINVEFLLMHCGFSLLLILLVSSMCLWTSVTASRYTEAMILSYMLQIPLGYCGVIAIGMMSMIVPRARGRFDLDWPWMLLAICAGPALLGTAFFYVIALRKLRSMRDMGWRKRTEPAPPRPPRPKPKRPRIKRKSTARAIPHNSLLWKEVEHNSYLLDVKDVARIPWIAVAVLACMGCAYFILQLQPRGDGIIALGGVLQALAVFGYIGMVGMIYLGMSFEATSAIAHERERNTLDFLLLLPIERREILFVKWIAPWVHHRMLLLAMVAFPLVGMVTGLFPAQTALLMLLLPLTTLSLVNTLGLFLSVVCRRTVTANILLVAILFAGFILHLLAWQIFVPLVKSYAQLIIAPFDPHFHEAPVPRAFWLVLGHQTFLLLLAIGFARLAFWRFDRQR